MIRSATFPEGRGDTYEVEDRGNSRVGTGTRYLITFDDGTVDHASTRTEAVGKIRRYLSSKEA